MTDTDATKKVELAQKHIKYQRQRIVQHKELITQLKRDHKNELLPAAHELLKDLEHVLAGMMGPNKRGRNNEPETSVQGAARRAPTTILGSCWLLLGERPEDLV